MQNGNVNQAVSMDSEMSYPHADELAKRNRLSAEASTGNFSQTSRGDTSLIFQQPNAGRFPGTTDQGMEESSSDEVDGEMGSFSELQADLKLDRARLQTLSRDDRQGHYKDDRRAYHVFLATLEKSFQKLFPNGEIVVPSHALKQWARAMETAYLGKNRQFHSFGHVMGLCEGSTPQQTLGALFHDIAYFSVDGGPPEGSAHLLQGILQQDAASEVAQTYIVLGANGDPVIDLVLTLFGVRKNQRMHPGNGLNEFASALIGAQYMRSHVPAYVIAEVTCCIEATIPFRKNVWADHLYERLTMLNTKHRLGMSPVCIEQSVMMAVDLGNKDVGDFFSQDFMFFITGTWALLPEMNPTIRRDSFCSITDWRCAIQKTYKFLSTLDPMIVFSQWRGMPDNTKVGELMRRAMLNVELGEIYTGIKLATCLLIEALQMYEVHNKKMSREGSFFSEERDSYYPSISGYRGDSKTLVNVEAEMSVSYLMRALHHHDFMYTDLNCNGHIDEQLSYFSMLLCTGKTMEEISGLIKAVVATASVDTFDFMETAAAKRVCDLFPPILRDFICRKFNESASGMA